MIDTVRGVLRVRKWPKKRGTPKSPLQRWWIAWFRQANLLAKYADGMTQARAIALTKGTGLYPRDIILKAMRGRLYIFHDENGKVWYPMAAVTDISESLDVLAQNIGSVLVRATDRWRAPVPGNFDDVMTYKGGATAPVWQAPAGGGGVVQQVLAGTPIVPDGTLNLYDFDVSAYATLNIQCIALSFASSSRPVLQFSTDGGATFKSGASDYSAGYVEASSDNWQNLSKIYPARLSSTSAQNANYDLTNLRAGRAAWNVGGSSSASTMVFRNGFCNFDGPITDVRVASDVGSNFTGGTIRLVGLK